MPQKLKVGFMPKNDPDLVFCMYTGGNPESINLNSSNFGDLDLDKHIFRVYVCL